MAIVDALFSVSEQDTLGGLALKFMGLLPGDTEAADLETVKN